jgi:hypothetical protein
MLDDVRFWSQVVEDARRVILCAPKHEAQIKAWLASRGYWLYEVRSTPIVPGDRVYIIDEQGLEAQLRQWQAGRWPA